MKNAYKSYLTPFFLLLFWNSIVAQATCDIPAALINEDPCTSPCYLENNTSFNIKLYFHVVRDGNGIGGQSIEDIAVAAEILIAAYAPYDIHFLWDGEVIYIDNFDLFDYQKKDKKTILNWNTHDDGIDIYLGPKYAASANGIPSTSLILGGTYNDLGEDPMEQTNIIVHEMGHCLGLLHTSWNNQDECVLTDNSNCCVSGDLVCDTPPQYMLLLPSFPGDCYSDSELYPHENSCDGEVYPSFSHANYMQYSHPSCMSELTLGQVDRMKFMLATSPQLRKIGAIKIEESTTWNTPMSFQTNVLIKSGNTLLITDEVKMHPGTAIIVETGARLIIDGGHITNNCLNEKWKGIIVEGNSLLNQFLQHQGEVKMINGAIVENAETGVFLYNPDIPLSSSPSTGGILQTNNATFLNNTSSVLIPQYDNIVYTPSTPFGTSLGNRTSFLQTDFIINDDYIGSPSEEFTAHVWLASVKGINFRGCQFINTNSSYEVVKEKGLGVLSFNSNFSIASLCLDPFPSPNPCQYFLNSSFEGFRTGVVAVNFGSINTFSISGTDFKNNSIGVWARAVNNIYLAKNSFLVGAELPYESESDAYQGVQLIACSGFKIEENSFTNFTDSYADGLTVGMAIIDAGSQENEVYKNNYSTLDYGNLVNGNNASPNLSEGLQFLCNVNVDNSKFDFAVPTNAFLREGQGRSNLPAGNEFTTVIPNTESELNFLNHSSAINYFHGNNNSPVNYSSLQNWGINSVNLLLASGNENECLSTLPEDDEVSKLTNDEIYHFLQIINATIIGENIVKGEQTTPSAIYQKAFNALLRFYSSNEEKYDIQKVRDLLAGRSDINAKLDLLNSYLQEKTFADFDEQLQLISTEMLPELNFQAYASLKELQKTFIADNRIWFELTEEEKADLLILSLSPGRTGIEAKNMLMLNMIWDEPLLDFPSGGSNNLEALINNGANVTSHALRKQENNTADVQISPNPVNNYLKVAFDKPINVNTVISLTNMFGQTLYKASLANKENVHIIDCHQLPSGIYQLLIITADAKIISSSQVFIQ